MAMQRRELALGIVAITVAAAAEALIFGVRSQQAGTEAVVPSAAFEHFRFSFFDDPNSVRDGLDTAALAALTGEERVRAEDLLIAALPDSRAIIGLGVLRSRRAEPRLVSSSPSRRTTNTGTATT
jgi:hypothetical protein